jgi:hypothetical protein
MKIVGFFTELNPRGRYARGSIHDAVSSTPQPFEREIAEYLDAGHFIIDYMEDGYDVIEGKTLLIARAAIKSDNTWVWRNDLAFYVRKYHLRLPEEFVQHARSKDFSMPPKEIPELIKRTHEFHEIGG